MFSKIGLKDDGTEVSENGHFFSIRWVWGSNSWKVDKMMQHRHLRFEVHTIYLLHRKNFFRTEISVEKKKVYEKSPKNAFLFWNACKITSACVWSTKNFLTARNIQNIGQKNFHGQQTKCWKNIRKSWRGDFLRKSLPPHF